MPLLGNAAMLLSFDVVPQAIIEHDDWHTHEHLPERLSIPGFVRGSRWVATRGHLRYLVIYEVEALATLTSDAYLHRLNNPSPWTTKMMTHYRGMARGFCRITGSFGLGIGGSCVLVRFKPEQGKESLLRKWLCEDALPGLAAKPGLGSIHLFEGAVTPAMTDEQRIRGVDAGIDWALVATGYRREALAGLAQHDTFKQHLAEHGTPANPCQLYQLEYLLSADEIRPRRYGEPDARHKP